MYRPKLFERVVNFLLKGVLSVLCRVDYSEVKKIPLTGPCLLAVNHINFLDIPVLYLYLQPRKVTGVVKKETWEKPFHGFLGNLWGAIPIRRGVVDTEGMRLCEEYLRDGGMLFIAPEGTRSGDGVMKPGKAGVVPLAVRAGVPVYPVAHYGGEELSRNLRRLRRAVVTIRVGRPFRIETGGAALTSGVRREIIDLIMYRIAGLLPEKYRGAYPGTTPEDTNRFLRDIPGIRDDAAV